MGHKFNYPALQRQYGGKYVAIYKGKVIAASRKASGVVEKIINDPRRPHIEVAHIDRSNAACIYDIFTSRKRNRSR